MRLLPAPLRCSMSSKVTAVPQAIEQAERGSDASPTQDDSSRPASRGAHRPSPVLCFAPSCLEAWQ